MGITAAVAADLATLTQALHDPRLDDAHLERLVREFAGRVQHAVPSYRGMSVRIATPVGDFMLTAMENTGDVGASLHLPLDDGGRTVTLYAGRLAAFAELAEALRSSAHIVVLDGHVGAPLDSAASATSLTTLSILNKAVGILVGRGFSRRDAIRELNRRAQRREAAVVDLATELIAATERLPGADE